MIILLLLLTYASSTILPGFFGTNQIWCAGMYITWNKLKMELNQGKSLTFNNRLLSVNSLINHLNSAKYAEGDIPKEDLLVMYGVEYNIAKKMNN